MIPNKTEYPWCLNNFQPVFQINFMRNICRCQIFLNFIAIVVEIFYLTTAAKDQSPTNNFDLTMIVIWCGLFGVIVGCFGLWIQTKPSDSKISTFMVLNLANGCFYLSFLVHAIMKATEIHLQRGDHETILTTMSIIHIIIGISQEAIILELCCFVMFLPKEPSFDEDVHISTSAQENIDWLPQLESVKQHIGNAILNSAMEP